MFFPFAALILIFFVAGTLWGAVLLVMRRREVNFFRDRATLRLTVLLSLTRIGALWLTFIGIPGDSWLQGFLYLFVLFFLPEMYLVRYLVPQWSYSFAFLVSVLVIVSSFFFSIFWKEKLFRRRVPPKPNSDVQSS